MTTGQSDDDSGNTPPSLPKPGAPKGAGNDLPHLCVGDQRAAETLADLGRRKKFLHDNDPSISAR